MANTQTTPYIDAPEASNEDLFAELRALTTKQRRERAARLITELRSRKVSLNKISEETGIARGTIQLWAPAKTETTAKEES
jgi:hypothetical protein